MVKADGSSKEIPLSRGSAVIGRDESCRLRVPVPSVSRRHCEVAVEDDEVVVRDLGSSNGTFVNGQRVKQAEVVPGDLLTVGPVVFVVRVDGHPRQIEASESYAAGMVGAEDLAENIPAPPPAPEPATPAARPGTPTAGSRASAPGSSSLLDDDDLSDLLKDFDFGDDEDEPPKAGPATPPTRKK